MFTIYTVRFPVDKAIETKATDTVSLCVCVCGEDGEDKGGMYG